MSVRLSISHSLSDGLCHVFKNIGNKGNFCCKWLLKGWEMYCQFYFVMSVCPIIFVCLSVHLFILKILLSDLRCLYCVPIKPVSFLVFSLVCSCFLSLFCSCFYHRPGRTLLLTLKTRFRKRNGWFGQQKKKLSKLLLWFFCLFYFPRFFYG